ncbi:MAG TPA: rhodanese-like domain-containing protein [Bacillota bacterium]|nr:rhodanese-like domain-containing protein [Bacillota bacterium]
MFLLKVGLIVLFIGTIIYRMLPARGVPQITPKELEKKLEENNSQLLDVRSSREFKAYHIKGFTNIPVRALRKNLDKLDKDKELIVICHTGVRSSDACKRLKRYGYTNLVNVKGGLSKWV